MRIRHASILLPLLLCGCGLPPAIAVASYAADGVLLMTTGKSSTDHALSFATGEDCAMWRVVKGETVCVELSEEGGSQIALADADRSATDASGDETGTAPQLAAAPDGAITREALAPPAGYAAPAGDTPAPATAVAAAPETAGTLRESDRVAVTEYSPSGAATGAPVALLPETAVTAPADPVAPVRIAPIPVRRAGAEPQLAAIATPGPVLASASAAPAADAAAGPPAGHYFVLASYRTRANAERHAAALDAAPAQIMTAEIDGVAHHRVLAGPFAPAERTGARSRLAAAGITEHWSLDLCGGACAGASQLASAD